MPTSQILLATTVSGVEPLVPFNLTLDASDNSRLGDTTTVQNNWWGTQTYDAGFATNIGQQSYQGFYAFTAGKAATLTATVSGASGWGNVRGRSITATFSIAVGDRIVFFAGKPTQPPSAYATVSSLGHGGGGGASCLMKYDTSLSSDSDYANGFIPLIIAAGGGEAGTNFASTREECAAAPPLSVTTSNTSTQIMSARNSLQPNAGLQAKEGGGGRDGTSAGASDAHKNQGAGNGWKGPSRGMTDGVATPGAVGLAYGAMGNTRTLANVVTADGGFGGGGFGRADSNYFGAGAGGYYGGFETNGCSDIVGGGTTDFSEYVGYGIGQDPSTIGDDVYGALSFVHSSGSSITDNGLYGSNSSVGNTSASQQNKGRVYLAFT
jgi:hypothetical protein